jgi:hypothetical protein
MYSSDGITRWESPGWDNQGAAMTALGRSWLVYGSAMVGVTCRSSRTPLVAGLTTG